MENIPPSDMNGDNIPTLDELLRPSSKRNAKASRQKRLPALNPRREDEDSQPESGLLTPPSSLTQEDDMDASRMLFSPPPEEVLRNVRNSVSDLASIGLPIIHGARVQGPVRLESRATCRYTQGS